MTNYVKANGVVHHVPGLSDRFHEILNSADYRQPNGTIDYRALKDAFLKKATGPSPFDESILQLFLDLDATEEQQSGTLVWGGPLCLYRDVRYEFTGGVLFFCPEERHMPIP